MIVTKEPKDLVWPEDFIDKVICGDCLSIVPRIPKNGEVGALITDPPYGIDGGTGGQSRERDRKYEGFDDTPEYIERVVLPVIRWGLNAFATVILTPGTRCLFMYPQPRDLGAMWQPACPRLSPFGFQTFQPILYYGHYVRGGKAPRPNGFVVTEAAKVGGHPCPKPLGFMRWLVEHYTLPDTIILDPFLGSGTTAVAAKQLGRKFIGIEINMDYCRIAEDRLRQEELF